MANNCDFNARVAGKKEDVDKVIAFMDEHHYDYCDVLPSEDESDYEEDVYVYGTVKWSLVSAWNMDKFKTTMYVKDDTRDEIFDKVLQNLEKNRIENPSLLDIKGDYILEAFSEEIGNGFQEHYVVKNGELVIDDARDYREEWDEEHNISYLYGGYRDWKLDFDKDKDIPEWEGETMD
jgi:hypothetical protein